MGSSVKSATNAITDAKDSVQATYRKNVSKGLREEINRGAAVAMPTHYAGNVVTVEAIDNGGDLPAAVGKAAGDLGFMPSVPVADPATEAAPTVYDPQQKRRRQAAGRAGTLLTGGMDGGGTNLGGAGGRSTLLGL